MFNAPGPEWSNRLSYFTTWQGFALAVIGLVLLLLFGIWWRQQTRQWFRVMTSTLLIALLMAIGSYYFFEVPPYYANCPQGCAGWRGYPLPLARMDTDGVTRLAIFDFALSVLLLWLLWLTAILLWRVLATAWRWEQQPFQTKLFFVVVFMLLPWALLPRLIAPPQPQLTGEADRLAINARRAAEFTYGITGAWVQQLALEDVRFLQNDPATDLESVNRVGGQVCLRGYTYFFIPWRRYRIDLDGIGRTALRLEELPLTERCWE